MTTIGQQRLIELVKGHPLAVARLREYQAAIDAAIWAVRKTPRAGAMREIIALDRALRDGGWIK